MREAQLPLILKTNQGYVTGKEVNAGSHGKYDHRVA